LPEDPVDDVPPPEGTTETPSEASTGVGLDAASESEAILAYHQRARLAEDRLAEVLAAYRSLKKETENFRDRTSRNMERRFQQKHARLLLKFIDILDNLDRALEAAQSSWAGQPLLEGMILVRTQLLQTLKAEGLERIPVLGMPFDPHVSEAVGTQPVSEPDQEHLVVKELMRGYRLHGKIARASRVVIGTYRAGEPAQETDVAPAEEVTIGAPADEEMIGIPVDAPPPPAEPAPAALEPLAEVAPAQPVEVAEANLEQLVETPREAREAAFPPSDDELSLEEIIRRAEAQEALFPQAFGHPDKKDE
jgi:molecular chaperone GrpE